MTAAELRGHFSSIALYLVAILMAVQSGNIFIWQILRTISSWLSMIALACAVLSQAHTFLRYAWAARGRVG